MLKLTDIEKGYPGGFKLRADLSVMEGEFVALLGPSGCGKTSLLRLISGLEQPDTGSILIRDRDVTRVEPHMRGIGMVFQDYALFPHLSVRGNVEYGLRMAGISRLAMKDKVDDALSLVGAGHLSERSIKGLSGGERQRVALARAIVREPSILLMDEPFSALDQRVRINLRREVKSLQERLGITLILVTHNQEEALSLADRVVVMDRGEIRQIGPPREVYASPGSPYVAGFLGDVSRVNAVISQDFTVKANGQELGGLKGFPPHSSMGVTKPGNAVIMFRPEEAVIVPSDSGPTGDSLRLSGQIINIEMLGPYFLCTLAWNGGEALFSSTLKGLPPLGSEVCIDIHKSSLLIYDED